MDDDLSSHDDNDVYEDDFYVVTDDPAEQMVNIALIERGLVIRFDYEEFRDFAHVVQQTRDYMQRRTDSSARNGR